MVERCERGNGAWDYAVAVGKESVGPLLEEGGGGSEEVGRGDCEVEIIGEGMLGEREVFLEGILVGRC